MSKIVDFTCPKCGFVIKAPYAEQVVLEHMKTHSNGNRKNKNFQNTANKTIKTVNNS